MSKLTMMFLTIGLVTCVISIVLNTILIGNIFTKKLTEKQEQKIKSARMKFMVIMIICLVIIMVKYMLLGKLV